MKYFLIIAFVFFSACSTVQSENEGALKKAEKKTIGILMGKTMTAPSPELKATMEKTDISKTKIIESNNDFVIIENLTSNAYELTDEKLRNSLMHPEFKRDIAFTFAWAGKNACAQKGMRAGKGEVINTYAVKYQCLTLQSYRAIELEEALQYCRSEEASKTGYRAIVAACVMKNETPNLEYCQYFAKSVGDDSVFNRNFISCELVFKLGKR
jgi:hypothetical protein